MVSFPYSRKKRYLTGIDWMVGTLDHMTRRATGVGNVSQVVLELDGKIDLQHLQESLRGFLRLYPLLSGCCKRDWVNLAPYWSTPAQTDLTYMLPVTTRLLAGAADAATVLQSLAEEVNTLFRARNQYLSFVHLRSPDKDYLAMKFDHRILDARGAEAMLEAFSLYVNQRLTDPPPSYREPPHLDRWREKFLCGQQVNRMFIRLRDGKAPDALPMPQSREQRRSAYVFKTYSREQTARVNDLADRHAGYLMLLPYLLGVTVHCIHRLFSERAAGRDYYMVPVNLDTRGAQLTESELFFNALSFAYFRFRLADADDLSTLWTSAREQFHHQVRNRLSHHLAEASMLMRIVPIPALAWLMRLPMLGGVASFSFSSVSEPGYHEDRFLGARLANIHHMPRVPTPPGVGVFFTRYGGRLNLVFSYLEGMLSPAEAAEFVESLDRRLQAPLDQ